MFDGSVDPSERRQAVSALADGELDTPAVSRACAAWREDADVRRTWHAYHLIGDVLRSDDLAVETRRDESFLAALRTRLADEPVVLAPQPSAVADDAAMQPGNIAVTKRRAWAAPMAVAAGFVAVAGVLAVTRVAGPVGPAVSGGMALAPSGNVAVQTVAASATPALAIADSDSMSSAIDMKLIRDVQLDRYLAAHKQYGNSTAVNMPGVVLRNAATFAPER